MNNYKYIGQLNIKNNENLPTPITVMVGYNNIKYIYKYFNKKIIDICKKYNYIGKLNINVKFNKGSNIKINKSVYISEENLKGEKDVIIWYNPRTKCNRKLHNI